MEAWQKVAAGDFEGAIQGFNSTGRFKLPEGTRFETRQEDDGFGAGRKITNYYAIAPDGREVNYRDMMRNAISPEKLLEIDSATGYRIADLSLKRTAEENAALRHTQNFQLAEMKYDKMIEEQRAQTRIALERLGLAKDEAKFATIQRGLLGAQTDLANLIITNKKYDPSTATTDDKLRHAAELTALGGAESIFQMNFDFNKGRAGIAPTQALDAWKMASRDPSGVKIDNETGFGYIQYGGKKVFVPRTMAPESKPQSQPSSTSPATSGIKTPTSNPPSVVTPAAGLQFDRAELPTNPAARRAAIASSVRENESRNNSMFASEVSALLPSLTPAQAVQIQRDGRFSTLPLNVRTQVFSVANQR